jgi:hypothetical protein
VDFLLVTRQQRLRHQHFLCLFTTFWNIKSCLNTSLLHLNVHAILLYCPAIIFCYRIFLYYLAHYLALMSCLIIWWLHLEPVMSKCYYFVRAYHLVILHGACTLCGFILCSKNNAGSYDCLEFSLLKYWLVSAYQYLTSEHLSFIWFSYFFTEARCWRMPSHDPRDWRHLFNVSCSLLLTKLENYFALLCAFRRTLVRRHLFADTFETTCLYSPLSDQRSDGNTAKDLSVWERDALQTPP